MILYSSVAIRTFQSSSSPTRGWDHMLICSKFHEADENEKKSWREREREKEIKSNAS